MPVEMSMLLSETSRSSRWNDKAVGPLFKRMPSPFGSPSTLADRVAAVSRLTRISPAFAVDSIGRCGSPPDPRR